MTSFKLHRNTRTALKIVVVTLLLVAGVVTLFHATSDVRNQADARIAYAGFDGNDYEIFTVNPDGSDLRQMTNNQVDDWGATWSPDRSMLAFRSMRDGNAAIYTMLADGSDVRRITPDYLYVGNPAFQATLTWSPDGSHIAYSASAGNNWDIYTSRIADSYVERLTVHPGNDLHPDWSVNDEIIFNSDRDGLLEIYTVDANNGNVTRLTNHDVNEGTYVFPRWSPDGDSFIFFKNFDAETADVFIVENGIERQITTDFAIDRVATFSPDGNAIVFRSERDGDSDIYTMNLRTGDVLPVTSDNNTNMSPDW